MKFQDFSRFIDSVQILYVRLTVIIECLSNTDLIENEINKIDKSFSELTEQIIKARAEVLENMYNSEGLKKESYEKYIINHLEGIQNDILNQFVTTVNVNGVNTEFTSIETLEFIDEHRAKFVDYPNEREFVKHSFRRLETALEMIAKLIPYFPDKENSFEFIDSDKLKWNGSPSLIAYIFLELAKQGYIELPTNKGEGSYAGYAKRIYKYFQITGSKGNPTTIENLIKEFNPNKNTIGIATSSKFTIPPLQKK